MVEREWRDRIAAWGSKLLFTVTNRDWGAVVHLCVFFRAWTCQLRVLVPAQKKLDDAKAICDWKGWVHQAMLGGASSMHAHTRLATAWEPDYVMLGSEVSAFQPDVLGKHADTWGEWWSETASGQSIAGCDGNFNQRREAFELLEPGLSERPVLRSKTGRVGPTVCTPNISNTSATTVSGLCRLCLGSWN